MEGTPSAIVRIAARSQLSDKRQFAKSIPATQSMKLEALKHSGLTRSTIKTPDLVVSVQNPVIPDAWLAFDYPDSVNPRVNGAHIGTPNGALKVEWINVPGATYLLDFELKSRTPPGPASAKLVRVQVSGVSWATVLVNRGRVLLAVPPVDATQLTRLVTLWMDEGEIIFASCEITKLE